MKRKGELTKNILKQVSGDIGISPDEVHIFPRGTFQRTTSGKVQRAKHKQLFLAGELKSKASLKDRIRYFKFRFSLLLSMCFYYVSTWIKRQKSA